MENFILHILKTNLLAAICIVFVTLLSRFMRKKYSSLWRYLMWFMTAVFLLIPVNPLKENAVVTLELSQNQYRFSTSYRGENISQAPVSEAVRSHDPSKTVVRPGESAISKDISARPKLTPSKALHLFFLCWISGSIFFLLFKISAYQFSLSNLKRWGIPEKDQKICDLYDSVCFEWHIKNPPALMTHFRLKSPVLTGLKNTTLYLPDASYSEKELKLIFAHELCHYQRRDLWYKMLLLTVNTIYWFNPFLYFMIKEAEKDVEYLCDSRVISSCSAADCTIYNRLLLKTAAASRYPHYLSAGLNDNIADFKERIRYMTKARTLKNGFVPVTLITLVLLLANLLVGCMVDSTPPNLDIPSVEKITSVQIGGIKFDSQKYDGSSGRLSNLVRHLKQAEPIDKKSAKSLQRDERYSNSIILRYEDKTKDIFYFFRQDDAYYVETEDGHFYRNDVFRDDVPLPEPPDSQGDTPSADTELPETTMSPEDAAWLKQELELAQQFEMLDLRFFFTTSVWHGMRYMTDASEEEDIIRSVRTEKIYEEKRYQYALSSGYGASEEEVKEFMVNGIGASDSFVNGYEEICTEVGTTPEKTLEKHKDYYQRYLTVIKMQEAKRQEFRNGSDTINGKECQNYQDYYNNFLMEILYPAMEDYDLSDFNKKLDEAEAFCREHPYKQSE